MIEIKQLKKYYGEVKAVNGINFTIEKGEVLGLLGPNGAGKSTAIRMLCCYSKPTAGSIDVQGINVLDNPEAVKQMIGYLPESAPLYGDMVVYDYLRYIANIRKIPRSKQHSRIVEMGNKCAIKEVMHKNISELSKGYKQRVGLAHALIGDPDILVLDEPTSGLDPNQIVEIRDLIKKIGKEKTVILCSHILSEVEATCNRVIIINQGKVVADGTTESLKKGSVKEKVILLEIASQSGIIEAEVQSALKNLSDKIEVSLLPNDNNEACYRYHLKYQLHEDLRSKIYELVRSKQWPLLTLYQERHSLENVFRELTQGNKEEVFS